MPNSRTSVTAPDGVAALTAAGYQVFAINLLAVTRYRDRNVSAQLTGRVHVFLTCAIPSAGPCVSFGRAATRPSQIPYDCSESTPALVPARCCWCGYAACYIDEGGARRLAA